MPSSSSSTRSSCSRSEHLALPRVRLAGPLLALACVALIAAGCGDSDEEAGGRSQSLEVPEPAGALRIAVDGPIETLDPLLAESRAERLASRQIHEPLVSSQAGPFGQIRERPGLARELEPSEGDTVWTATLRPRVRFQDGRPLDAEAVRVNAARWLATTEGRALLPALAATDTPRPGEVRFLLDRPDPQFGNQLRDAHLGLISPGALADVDDGLTIPGDSLSGTGPFELRGHEGDATLLARNSAWWGTPRGLGPGINQIELTDLRDPRLRADGLAGGAFEIADQLDADLARAVRADPLLTVVVGGGTVMGAERSVRGIETARADQPLADAWLTDIR